MSRRSRWHFVTWPVSGSPRIWPDTSPGNPIHRSTCSSTRGDCAGRSSPRRISCVVDADARVIRGRWDVTPAIHIHTELQIAVR